MRQYEISFQPDGITVSVAGGVTLMEAAGQGGIILDSVCGGAGTCNKCLVEIAGESEAVRSCQYRVDRDLVVTIPDSSRFFEQQILQEGIDFKAQVEPMVCKHYLQLAEPSLGDLRSDAQRLTDAVAQSGSHTCRDHSEEFVSGTTVAWPLLRQLPAIFRRSEYRITAVCHCGRVFAVEPGDTTGTLYGLAVDVGTTTVVATLVNLIDGKAVAVASQTNSQVSYGDDVISRIEYTRSRPEGLSRLEHRIIDCVNQLIGEVCEKAAVSPWHIYEMTVAGNATMQHLFLGIPVEQIAQAPYVSAICEAVNVSAVTLKVEINPQGNVYVMPSVAAHIGGDTVAVSLATALRQSEAVNLAIDIGTNGELLLGNKERLLACSTAAGPAFEGARIGQGMRAAAGAIERVYIKEDVEVSVIGGGAAKGICGSGLVDAVAELLEAGLIEVSGRLLGSDSLSGNVSDRLRRRIIETNDGVSFVLVDAEQSGIGKDILLTQRDIREVQLGKAAISAGVVMLMESLGVGLDEIEHLFLAGAFGNYIRPESALRMGLLPAMPLSSVKFVGNAAGTGARQVLVSGAARRHAEQLARQIEYVELAGQSRFQDIFSEKLFFGN